MKLVVTKVQEKSDPGDYSEFEEMRASLMEFIGDATPRLKPMHMKELPPSPRGVMIALLSILSS